MEDINKIIGQNLSKLRKNAKLTQLELAEKFNYSDKSISKWEAGESLPSIDILYNLACFYNVTLNDLTTENSNLKPNKEKVAKPKVYPAKPVITLLSVCAVWLCATVVFIVLRLSLQINYSMAFIWAIPASFIVLTVFNSIWGHFKYLFPILTFLLWTALMGTHLQVLFVGINIWPIYLVGIPLQIGIILWGALVKRPKEYYQNLKEQNK